MDSVTFLGLAAAVLTSTGAFPQVVKSWKTKSTKDLSLAMLLQVLAGLSLWTAYGLFRKDTAILLAQAIAAIFYISLLILKIRYK